MYGKVTYSNPFFSRTIHLFNTKLSQIVVLVMLIEKREISFLDVLFNILNKFTIDIFQLLVCVSSSILKETSSNFHCM